MAVTILFIAFFALLLLGVPVAFSLLTASLLTVLYLGLSSVVVVLQTAAGASSSRSRRAHSAFNSSNSSRNGSIRSSAVWP